MRLVFAIAIAASVLAGCDLVPAGGTAVRAVVTADGRPFAGARAALFARDPGNPSETYTVLLARGVTREDGRVTLLVPDDDAALAASGYRLSVVPPDGILCNRTFFEAVDPGTDTDVTLAFTDCAARRPTARP